MTKFGKNPSIDTGDIVNESTDRGVQTGDIVETVLNVFIDAWTQARTEVCKTYNLQRYTL